MTSIKSILSDQRDNLHLIVLRVMAGSLYFMSGMDKFMRESYANSMDFIFNNHWTGQAYGFYQPFLDNVVLPNLEFWAAFVTFAEFAIGIGLIFGLLTRIAAVGGFFLNLNIIFASGASLIWPGGDMGLMIICGILIWTRAGRFVGVDEKLVARYGEPQGVRKYFY